MALLLQSSPFQTLIPIGQTRAIFLACQYGKMHCKPWRMKGNHLKVSRVATKPGQIVSVNQLEPLTPGFIAQLKAT